MKIRQLIGALCIATSTTIVHAQPTYEQALNFRNSMYTLMSRSILKLDKPEEFRAYSLEISKLEPMAIRLFGVREKSGAFEVCINAASAAWDYWQNQISTVMKPSAFGIGSSARAGFDFGQYYARCSDQIETLDKRAR